MKNSTGIPHKIQTDYNYDIHLSVHLSEDFSHYCPLISALNVPVQVPPPVLLGNLILHWPESGQFTLQTKCHRTNLLQKNIDGVPWKVLLELNWGLMIYIHPIFPKSRHRQNVDSSLFSLNLKKGNIIENDDADSFWKHQLWKKIKLNRCVFLTTSWE